MIITDISENIIPDYVISCAERERISLSLLKKNIMQGSAVIPRSTHSPVPDDRLCIIGEGVRTKVNANIGTSPDKADLSWELEKLYRALEAATDTVMDLSIGGDIAAVRQAIRKICPVPMGTVPIYQCVCETVRSGKTIAQLDIDHLFTVIEQQADEGIDFITVHCGITKQMVEQRIYSQRIAGVVSRGGSFIIEYIKNTGKENPLYEQFDRLLEITRKYDLTLSLGDGLRPGALADAGDRAQMAELLVLSELVDRARKASVQVMVEGPGHVPINQIAAQVHIEKTVCHGAPFYVLGPLVTDVGAGYDHITSAIGGAVASAAGADFLCYVTPSEHIHLPEPDDVYMGVIASRLAAHAGDIAKGIPHARAWDDEMSKGRKALDWGIQQKYAIDQKHFQSARVAHKPLDEQVCTMCGEFCAMREPHALPKHEEVEANT